MVHLKNVEVYTPEKIPEELALFGVTFFRSEDGVDFYEALKEMKEDTVKSFTLMGLLLVFYRCKFSVPSRCLFN